MLLAFAVNRSRREKAQNGILGDFRLQTRIQSLH